MQNPLRPGYLSEDIVGSQEQSFEPAYSGEERLNEPSGLANIVAGMKSNQQASPMSQSMAEMPQETPQLRFNRPDGQFGLVGERQKTDYSLGDLNTAEQSDAGMNSSAATEESQMRPGSGYEIAKAGGGAVAGVMNALFAAERQKRKAAGEAAELKGAIESNALRSSGGSQYGALQKLMQSYRFGTS